MKQLLLALIRMYQKHVSPAFPPRCRFIPTCSQYAAEAISKYDCWPCGVCSGATPLTRGISTTPFPKFGGMT